MVAICQPFDDMTISLPWTVRYSLEVMMGCHTDSAFEIVEWQYLVAV